MGRLGDFLGLNVWGIMALVMGQTRQGIKSPGYVDAPRERGWGGQDGAVRRF
jgi:hypothetical protein